MHNAFVQVDKEKMSKSLGNFFSVRDILKKYDPEVVRFFIVRAHYRSPLNYSDAHLEDAKSALTRLYTALKSAPPTSTEAFADALMDAADWTHPFAVRFKQAMDDDFGTPDAIAVLFDIAREIGKGQTNLAPLLRRLGGILGIVQRDPLEFLRAHKVRRSEVHLSDDDVELLVGQRQAAKVAKDFKKADDIRRQLVIYGVVVEDTKVGLSWRRATSFRTLELDELEDFRFEASKFGYEPRNFEIKEFAGKRPTGGIYPVTDEIEVRYIPTGKSKRFRVGHMSTWLQDISDLFSSRFF
jgi:cysteinyl-tRNA synthetase